MHDVEATAGSMMLTPKELFLVVNPGRRLSSSAMSLQCSPGCRHLEHDLRDQRRVRTAGGSTSGAYREDEQQKVVPRNKSIAVKSVTLNVQAFASADSGLIPAVWGPDLQEQGTGETGHTSDCRSNLLYCVAKSAGNVPFTETTDELPSGLHRFTPATCTRCHVLPGALSGRQGCPNNYRCTATCRCSSL